MRALFRQKRLAIRTVIRSLLFCLLAGALLSLLWIGDSSLQVLARQEQEVAALQAVVLDLQEGIATINAEMHAFDTDEYVLEKLAREQLGMGKAGETVYVLG